MLLLKKFFELYEGTAESFGTSVRFRESCRVCQSALKQREQKSACWINVTVKYGKLYFIAVMAARTNGVYTGTLAVRKQSLNRN